MKPTITVLSLGPGDPGLMTLQTADKLREAEYLVLRTGQHGAAAWLNEQGIAYKTMDAFYEHFDDFDRMHADMARALWERAAQTPVTYAVMDATTDGSVAALEASQPGGATLTILPGLTTADACLAAAPKLARKGGVRVLPAMDAPGAAPDPETPLIITEIDTRILASEVKLWLTDLYDDEMQVIFFPPSENAQRKAVALELSELDRQKKYDHTCCLYVPAAPLNARSRYCFMDLVRIMELLRGPGGCPWDREQTHESLRKYLIEEAYEAVTAIDEDDTDHLADELGDVLLQIVFHASVGQSHGTFAISDVTSNICGKMIYRHAHVFGTADCKTAGDVSVNWEKLKKTEKGLTTQSSVLQDVSKGLPALMRAAKVQKKAADVGFDWDTALEALPKVHEEADEVREEIENGRDPAEELGDLLFSCVNVARLCKLEPELLLKSATEKFIRRFSQMENLIISDGKALEGLTLSEMDVYWNQVKAQGHA